MKNARLPRFGSSLTSAIIFIVHFGQATGAEIDAIETATDTNFQLNPSEATAVDTPTFAGIRLASEGSVAIRRFAVKPRMTYTLYVGSEGAPKGSMLYLFGIDPRNSLPTKAPYPQTTRALRLNSTRWGDASFARYNITIAPESSSEFLYLVSVFEPGATSLVAELLSEPVPDLVVEDPDHIENADSLSDEWRNRHAKGPCSGWVFDQQILLTATSTGQVVIKGSGTPTDLAAAKDEPYAVVRVFFGTDRNRTGEPKLTNYFGTDRGEMALGTCDVSIPRDHRLGSLERPSIWKLEFRENPEKHVVILSLQELEEDRFNDSVKERVSKSEEKQAFVFVHGYNVTFDSAIMRAAQIHYDLAFDGAPIVFSWPSKGSITGYPADEASIEWTLPHLEAFLQMVARESGARKLHLVAHSMGNRALVRTLVRLIEKNGGLPENIDNIVLTAPDIDADVFARDLAPALVDSGKTVTLYASDSDNALIASKKVHQAPRAGDSGGGLIILDGMDTVDASGKKIDFLGHSYYANSRTVIGDLFKLIRGYSPERRQGLSRGMLEPKGVFWFFRDREAE